MASSLILKCITSMAIVTNVKTETATGTELGIVYSPFVRQGDRENSQEYTREMVKVMLKVVFDAGYTAVTTYGMGSPDRPYDNRSISDCSSIVHTAMAAAEINRDRNYLAMTVYEGLYNTTRENQVECEIEVGIEIAAQANNLFYGTVPAIVYPSNVNFHDLIDDAFVNSKIKIVSNRTRSLNLQYGVRVTDCQTIPLMSEKMVNKVLQHFGFIICVIIRDLNFEAEKVAKSAIFTVMQTKAYIQNVTTTDKDVELILETGWPGDRALKAPNTVHDLIRYWKIITDWSVKSGVRVFLHEAFDSAWKNTHPEWILAAHFGRWEYNEKESNLLSKNAYKLKQDFAWSIFGGFGVPQIGILVGSVALIALVTMIILLYKRVLRIEGATPYILGQHDIAMFFDGITDNSEDYIGEIWEKSPYDNQLELNKNSLKVEVPCIMGNILSGFWFCTLCSDKTEAGLLGKGQFGCVYKGKLFNSDSCQDVAVKMTRACFSSTEVKCLMSEIKMLTYIGSHPHICTILGAYTKEISKGIIYFAMEFCTLGNLESYLRKNNSKFAEDLQNYPANSNDYVTVTYSKNDTICLTDLQLVRWSFEIASAMKYISSKNVIHSDLAARNILLTVDLATRVTDFGLSRRFVDEDPNYSKSGTEPLPWKWLAPESLEFKRFSVKSDVWAYGVAVWEIFSLGKTPQYEPVRTWNDLLPHLKTGKRLKQPEHASDVIYNIMLSCWNLEPVDRPSFTEIIQSFIAIIDMDYQDLTE